VRPGRSDSRVEEPLQPPVRVRHHDQPEPARPERLERRRDVGLHVLLEVVFVVVGTQIGERRVGGVRERKAGLLEHQVEVQPAALPVVGCPDERGFVQHAHRMRLGGRQARGVHRDAMSAQGIGHARPGGVHQHAAGVEEERVDRGIVPCASHNRLRSGSHGRDELGVQTQTRQAARSKFE
jgi:hypothetical protein